ncbi:MAG: flagellar basal-body MS-ring/collar protein FliF [Pseudomonadota bacterium]
MAETANTTALSQNMANLELGTVLKIPAVRQVSLLVGVAASVALGVAAFLWAQGSNYQSVFSGLNMDDAAQMISTLNSAGIDSKLGSDGSSVMVPADRMDAARLELAGSGLSVAGSSGIDDLSEQSSFGVSQFMESARYQHALEAELVRTIRNLRAVQDARVHLAIPKQSSFIRNRDKPSASVLLNLYRGQTLSDAQTQSIVHLVASSVSNLHANAVTVIDQHGSLLSGTQESNSMSSNARQFDYARNLEDTYRRKLMELMVPIVGPGRVRAEVVADLDFTQTEETRESYDPSGSVIRSEQLNERTQGSGSEQAQGIPGALSNQPPETGGVASEGEQVNGERLNRSVNTVRNFELDKTVSVRRLPSGTIRRLSVAVLIDDNTSTSAESATGAEEGGEAASVASSITPEQIEQYTSLIKEAIGFNEARGDSVSVIAAAFAPTAPAMEVEETPMWKQAWVLGLARNVVGVLVVLGIAFGVGKPLVSGLLATTQAPVVAAATPTTVASTGEVLPAGTPVPGNIVPATQMFTYDQKVAAAKNITGHDPARVAQVLKKWVATDE